MKFYILILYIFIMFNTLLARIIYVGPGQQYSTIQAAINVSQTNDTIKVLPGIYNESITINKNIVVLGSGYEATRIIATQNPAVTISSGKIMWFYIMSSGNVGVNLTGGIVSNCVIAGCAYQGVYFPDNSQGQLINSVIYGNGGDGASGHSRDGVVINSIAAKNGAYAGFYELNTLTNSCTDKNISYINNSTNNFSNTDPQFVSATDFHLRASSPCINSGNPVYLDPDGSRSDMGYFGGPGCPIYPVITQIRIVPQGSGQVKIQATAQANY